MISTQTPPVTTVIFDRDYLRKQVARVAVAADNPKWSIPVLTSVAFYLERGKLSIMSTDRFRLATVALDSDPIQTRNGETAGAWLAPAREIGAALKMAPVGPVEIGLDIFGDVTVNGERTWGSLSQERPLPVKTWRGVMLTSDSTEVTVDRLALARALDGFKHSGAVYVRVTLADGTLSLVGRDREQESSGTPVELSGIGTGSNSLGFSADFLHRAVKSLAGVSRTVTLRLTEKAVVLTVPGVPVSEYAHVLMKVTSVA